MEKRFIQFLKDEGCHDAFVKNMATLNEYTKDISILAQYSPLPSHYVSSAFMWYKSPEGFGYWDIISNKWKMFCGELV